MPSLSPAHPNRPCACRFDPLWNSLVVGGYYNGQPFLGSVGMIGTNYTDQHVATGAPLASGPLTFCRHWRSMGCIGKQSLPTATAPAFLLHSVPCASPECSRPFLGPCCSPAQKPVTLLVQLPQSSRGPILRSPCSSPVVAGLNNLLCLPPCLRVRVRAGATRPAPRPRLCRVWRRPGSATLPASLPRNSSSLTPRP
jgi:hypothetical protein